MNAILRFESKIIKSNSCWIWSASKDKKGYGNFRNIKMERAHRFSYETYKGPIPEDMYVCHSCDVPSCVNPDHLWLGTAKDNSQDRDKKGRHNCGNKIKTHCSQGHEYTLENTYMSNNRRYCRTCRKIK